MIVLLLLAAYSGHGEASVSKETLDKFAPPRLPAETSREIQAMLDVRGTAQGVTSPDGTTLYFNWNVTGIRQVWAAPGALRFPHQLTGGEDTTLVGEVSPDNRFLVMSRDRKGEENPGLYLQPTGGGALELVQHKSGAQTQAELVSDDSRYVYFRSNDVKQSSYGLYRWDVSTKRKETVWDQDGLWRAVDRKNDKLLVAKEVGGNMAEYYELDEKTKALTPLFGQGEREDYDAAYGAGDGEILVKTPKLSEFRRLYVWKAGTFTAITPELKADVKAFTVDRQRTRIAVEIDDRGYGKVQIYDAKTKKALPLPALPQVDNVHLGRFSGHFLTLALDAARLIPSLYVWDTDKNVATRWVEPSSPEIDPSHFSEVVLDSYPARDGTLIPVFVRKPQKCTKACPVIVQFHGGPESQALAGFDGTAQLFVDQGFIFIEPNVRGSDGYGKTWLHSDDGPNRLKVITDIEDAAKWAKTKFADGGAAPKVGVYGGSYGGYSTLVAMTMFAGAYDAGMAVVGMSNLVTFLENTAPYRRALRVSEYGDPVKDKEALTKLSPVTYLDRVKAPVMLSQGATDPRVPVGEAVQMFEAMQKKGLQSKLMIFADEGHGMQKRENRVLNLGHALRFFREHLMGVKVSATGESAKGGI